MTGKTRMTRKTGMNVMNRVTGKTRMTGMSLG